MSYATSPLTAAHAGTGMMAKSNSVLRGKAMAKEVRTPEIAPEAPREKLGVLRRKRSDASCIVLPASPARRYSVAHCDAVRMENIAGACCDELYHQLTSSQKGRATATLQGCALTHEVEREQVDKYMTEIPMRKARSEEGPRPKDV